MDDKKQIEVLKILVISLARAYQKNYDDFAASSNYSYEIKNAVKEETYDNIMKVFYHFATIQGRSYRDLIAELSTLNLPNQFPVDLDEVRKLFEYDRIKVRENLYNKTFSDEAKIKKLERIKKIWES